MFWRLPTNNEKPSTPMAESENHLKSFDPKDFAKRIPESDRLPSHIKRANGNKDENGRVQRNLQRVGELAVLLNLNPTRNPTLSPSASIYCDKNSNGVGSKSFRQD